MAKAGPITHWNGFKWTNSNFHRDVNSSRAILVCGGPSLANIDPDSLKGPGKVVLGVNNTYPYVVPDMWMGMDDPRCYDRRVLLESFPKFLRGGYQDRVFQNFKPMELYNVHYINVMKDTKMAIFDRAKPGCLHFIWHNNVMAVAMNLLFAMGFKEIYIAGCDLDNSEKDYFDERVLVGNEKARNTSLYKHLFKWLRIMTEEGAKRGIRLHSLSPTSGINEFMPYVSIEELNELVERDLPKPGELHNAWTLSQLLKTDQHTTLK